MHTNLKTSPIALCQAKPFSAFFLPIDVQHTFLRPLGWDRANGFVIATNQMADAMREQKALVTWIAFQFTKETHFRPSPCPDIRKRQLYDSVLEEASVSEADYIIPKSSMNAFSNLFLVNLRNSMPDAPVIIAGANTTECVFNTIRGALAQPSSGHCFVVYDRLADASPFIHAYGPENDPQTHKKALETLLPTKSLPPQQARKLAYVTADEVLETAGLRRTRRILAIAAKTQMCRPPL